MGARRAIFTEQQFRALDDHTRFVLSAAVLFGAAALTAKVSPRLGIGMAAVFAGVFVVYGGAINGKRARKANDAALYGP